MSGGRGHGASRADPKGGWVGGLDCKGLGFRGAGFRGLGFRVSIWGLRFNMSFAANGVGGQGLGLSGLRALEFGVWGLVFSMTAAIVWRGVLGLPKAGLRGVVRSHGWL